MTVIKSPSKPLPGGIYCPTITFFLDTPEQELDIPSHTRHMEFLAKSGINGVVVQGSTGEAVALNRDERMQVSQTLLTLSGMKLKFFFSSRKDDSSGKRGFS